MQRVLAATIAIAIACVVADAAPKKDGTVRVLGPGVESCGKWIADRKAGLSEFNQWFNAVYWVQGYLTALSMERGDSLLERVDGPAIPAWLDLHCKDHPLDTILDSAEALAKELHKRENPGSRGD